MGLIKSVINLITFLIIFGAGVEGLEALTQHMKGEAVKAHKRGVINLQDWNSMLNKPKSADTPH